MGIESIVFKDFYRVGNNQESSAQGGDVSKDSGEGEGDRDFVVSMPQEITVFVNSSMTTGKISTSLTLLRDNKYLMVVYPGSDAVLDGRGPAEHKCEDGNYHVHINESFGEKREYRINCGTFEELDGHPLPKDLKKCLMKVKASKHPKALHNLARDYYEKGKFDKDDLDILRDLWRRFS